MRNRALFAVLVVLALLIGGFSLFVGWNKAFAPHEVLVEHLAWTIHLPATVGRIVGWLEMLAATVLIASLAVPRFARAGMWAAVWITANHVAAAVVHVSHGETSTYAQSVVVIALCLMMVRLARQRVRP